MLIVNNLTTKNIGQKDNVLENINLDFKENQVVAIIGLSGVGKTTLLNSICINTEIVNGSIKFNEFRFFNKHRKHIRKYRKNIGIISQKSTLIDDISVYDNLKLYLSESNNWFYKTIGFITKNQTHQIYNVLEKLGIISKVFYKAKDLSGGEAQRVEIAKLMLRKPKIILADEPTSNLDINNSNDIIKYLKEIAVNNNSIVIINIHDIDLLKENIDRVIGIKNKGILFDKRPNELTKVEIKILYEK